jgi:hypothetical protein
MAPEGADGAVHTPRTEAYALVGEAEQARLDGHSDPYLWAAAAKAWQRLGEPYPTAYARWREAEAQLLGGVARDQVESSLRAAHAAAVQLGAAPLRTETEALVHQSQDGDRPRLQHPRQARRPQPGRSGHHGPPTRGGGGAGALTPRARGPGVTTAVMRRVCDPAARRGLPSTSASAIDPSVAAEVVGGLGGSPPRK